MFWAVAISTSLAVLFFPSEAWAWGLATHVEVGRVLLSDYRDVLQAFASCVLNHPQSFLYGSISPDHFLMKNLKSYRDHSHNWDRAFAMLKRANTEELEAFALGYLAHLAADTVAHNVFVPNQIATSSGVAARAHTLWELRFDTYQPPEAAAVVRDLERMPEMREFDRYLAGFHSPSVFDLPTNLQFTSGAHRVLHHAVTRTWVEKWERRSVSPVAEEDVLFYNRLSMLYVLDVIRHGRNSIVVGLDPRGGEQIATAKVVGKRSARGVADSQVESIRFVGHGPKPAVPSRKSLHGDGLTAYLNDHSHMTEAFGFRRTRVVQRWDSKESPTPVSSPGRPRNRFGK